MRLQGKQQGKGSLSGTTSSGGASGNRPPKRPPQGSAHLQSDKLLVLTEVFTALQAASHNEASRSPQHAGPAGAPDAATGAGCRHGSCCRRWSGCWSLARQQRLQASATQAPVRDTTPAPAQGDKYGAIDAHYAACVGDVPCLKELLKTNPASAQAASMFGMTPTHVAALNGRTEALNVLLQAAPATATSKATSWTLLHCAASEGQAHAVKRLVKAAPETASQPAKAPLPSFWRHRRVRWTQSKRWSKPRQAPRRWQQAGCTMARAPPTQPSFPAAQPPCGTF